MGSTERKSGSPFAGLDEPVSFASSSRRVVRTDQSGRVIGFGCSGAEKEAHDALENYVKQAREQSSSAGQQNFESEVKQRTQKLEQAIIDAHRKRASGA